MPIPLVGYQAAPLAERRKLAFCPEKANGACAY